MHPKLADIGCGCLVSIVVVVIGLTAADMAMGTRGVIIVAGLIGLIITLGRYASINGGGNGGGSVRH